MSKTYQVYRNHVMVIKDGVQTKKSMKWWLKKQIRERLIPTTKRAAKAIGAVGASAKQAEDALKTFVKTVTNIKESP